MLFTGKNMLQEWENTDLAKSEWKSLSEKSGSESEIVLGIPYPIYFPYSVLFNEYLEWFGFFNFLFLIKPKRHRVATWPQFPFLLFSLVVQPTVNIILDSVSYSHNNDLLLLPSMLLA